MLLQIAQVVPLVHIFKIMIVFQVVLKTAIPALMLLHALNASLDIQFILKTPKLYARHAQLLAVLVLKVGQLLAYLVVSDFIY